MLDEYELILTPEEVSEVLRIGMNRTYDLLRTGKLKAFREGRIWKIPKVSLLEYISTRCNDTDSLL
ncbi:hypothetical protein I230019B6_18410 [Firmicutes bacterium i23-0019-B6]